MNVMVRVLRTSLYPQKNRIATSDPAVTEVTDMNDSDEGLQGANGNKGVFGSGVKLLNKIFKSDKKEKNAKREDNYRA